MASSTTIEIPLPILKRRNICESIERNARRLGHSPVAARVLAGRALLTGRDLSQQIAPGLDALDTPWSLADIEISAQRLAGAILRNEVIGIATDYDMDGLGAHASFRWALVKMFGHPARRLRSYIGHRLAEGYGLTPFVAQRVMNDELRPTLLVTADNGSGDEPRIGLLADAGVDVIVTDHHALPLDGPPRSAFACVNPQRPECGYPDKAIAGGMVIWLLLRAVQQILIEAGYRPAQMASLDELLDFVACSTVADCVSMASYNNRAVVSAGLALMNQLRRPCWQALAQLLRIDTFTSESIAFGVAPRINARTRLDDPFAALHFLLAADQASAVAALKVLDKQNQARREIERAMLDRLLPAAARRVAEGYHSIVLQLPDGHPGVQGICSARLVEAFGRPAFLFSPHAAEKGVLTGSGRTVEGVDVAQILRQVETAEPGLIQRFGGHKAAAGAQLRTDDFPMFVTQFERAAAEAIAGEPLQPVRLSDGELSTDQYSLALVKELDALAPTGKGFEPATFDGEFRVVSVRVLGDGTHLRLQLRRQCTLISAVWFRARNTAADPLPVRPGECVRLVYRVTDNDFNGRHRFELQISARVRGSLLAGDRSAAVGPASAAL